MYRMPVPISSCSYLGPAYLPKPTRPEICSHPHPVAIKLLHLPPMEYGIRGGLCCLAIRTLAAPSTLALALPSDKKGTTLFPPQGETLPHDCHRLAQFLPYSGIR